MNKQLVALETETAPVLKEAEGLSIKKPEDMTKAAEMLSQVNILADKIVEEREKVTKPLNDALKAERARWKPYEAILDSARDLLRGKMSDYQTKAKALEAGKKDKIIEKLGNGTIDADKAIEKFDAITVNESVEANTGRVTFKTDLQVIIHDAEQVPARYVKEWNMVAIKADFKKGIVIPGTEVKEIQVPINYR